MHDRNELKRSAAATDTALQRAMNQAVNPHDAPSGNITALRDNEMEFRRLVAGLTDHAICLLGIDGSVLSWNNGAERINGYRGEEIIGEHFSRFYTPEDRNAGEPGKALDIATHQGKYEAEAWRIRKDGRRFWANVVIDAIRNSTGRLVGFASVTRDVTEKRAMEEQLHQSQKMEAIGQLTGGVAHDFNNLLTVIIGNLETIALLMPTDNERLRRAMEQATLGAQRAAALTQQLLAFSRRQPLNPKLVDVNELVVGMSDLLSRVLGEAVSVKTSLSAGLWPVKADPHQLESSLLNLAVNARDAMPEGGTLSIETANSQHYRFDESSYAANVPGEYVLIRVTDTGLGMDTETSVRAFEPFFTTKAMGQGTGLGLSQVYGFVRQSGGQVRIHSAKDRGTAVEIYLPPLKLEREGVQSVPVMVQQRGHETILVVEDESSVRMFTTGILRELGYSVLEASDGPASLRVLEQHPEVHLMFVDVGLPGMNGRQLAEQATQRRSQLKVLFTSGYAQDAVANRLEPGVELLTKPYTRVHLAARIRSVLDSVRR
jgi:PAS domain S-box-containing protein